MVRTTHVYPLKTVCSGVVCGLALVLLLWVPSGTHLVHAKGGGEPHTCAPGEEIGPLVVNTTSGPVRGLVLRDHMHWKAETVRVRSWKGIPFAAPPVGRLRFRLPEKHPGWHHEPEPFAALDYGPACVQFNRSTSVVLPSRQSEDCLSLNIWAPLHDSERGEAYPVLVFLPGGGFASGGSNVPPDMVTGNSMADENIVMVSLNYRIGILGFLALEDLEDDAKGNFGMYDQVAAFQWVYDNIAAFGGDPERMTLMGNSAGALSACAHMVSPFSRHFFDKVILSSGPCSLYHYPLDLALAQGRKAVKQLGCDPPSSSSSPSSPSSSSPSTTTTSVEHIRQCLRALSAPEVLGDLHPKEVLLFGEGYVWGPVVDGVFLPHHPWRALQPRDPGEGKGDDEVDRASASAASFTGLHPKLTHVLMGSNLHDGTVFGVLKFPLYLSDAYYRHLLHQQFGDRVDAVLQLYGARDHAFGCQEALGEILGDLLFTCGVRATSRRLVQHNVTTFAYVFSYIPEHKLEKKYIFGAHHGLDLYYLFHQTDDDVCHQVSGRMIQYFSNFIHHGSPNARDNQLEWHPFTEDSEIHLNINVSESHEEAFRCDRCDVLDSFMDENGQRLDGFSQAREPVLQHVINHSIATVIVAIVTKRDPMPVVYALVFIVSVVVTCVVVLKFVCCRCACCGGGGCGRRSGRRRSGGDRFKGGRRRTKVE